MAENTQTKLTKRAYATQEDAKRGALTKTVRNFKLSVKTCEDALAQRIKDGEKEIAFFKAEQAAAEKMLVDFEAAVTAEAEKE
jgi:hypothetical protein